MNKGKLIVVSGPSAGVGKDTVLKMFLAKHPDWIMPVSTTTRQPRKGEVDGQDMQFVDSQTFDKWREEEKFLEAIQVNDGKWYGTLKKPVEDALSGGKNVILRKDVRGAFLIKERLPQSILIFITAENWEALESRIRGRATETPEQIKKRLELAKHELKFQDKYDHVIINPTNHPEEAVQELKKIVNN